jgi:hypothetical protein
VAVQLSLLLLKWAKLKQLSLLWVVHQSVLTALLCADGVVMAKEIYEILGRPVTKEQYEAAAKKMDAPQSEAEKEMDDFAKRARERAAQRKLEKTAMGKKKGGLIKSSASKRADGIAIKGKTRGKMV